MISKVEAFCRAVALEGMSLSDAYRASRDCSSMQTSTINSNAKRLGRRESVKIRIAQLKMGHEVTLDSLVDELEEARKIAIVAQLPSAAVAATMGKAKLLGLIVDRSEHTGKDLVPDAGEDDAGENSEGAHAAHDRMAGVDAGKRVSR